MIRRIALLSFIMLALSVPSGAYDPRSVVIGLERGPCYGTCPVYGVTIYGDGTVRYNGANHVRVKGSQTAVIAPERVKALIDEIERSGFFNLRDDYIEVSVTDAPSAVLYAAVNGKKKQVRHYLGDFKAPAVLEAIESRIDETAGVQRWTADAVPSADRTASSKEIPATAAPVPVPGSGSTIAQDTERQKITLRRTIATSLRDEAYALQQKGQLRDAVIRYRQSLVYWPDTGLETYIAPLEKRTGFTVSQYRPQALQAVEFKQGTEHATSKRGVVYATIRNRSDQDIHIQARGEPPEAATQLRAGEILIRPVRLAPNGEVIFLVSRNGKAIASRSWFGSPDSPYIVPAVLYDDNLNDKLLVMTGLR